MKRLALILALAFPVASPAEEPVFATGEDLAFSIAVEVWVKEAHAVRRYERVLSRPDVALLRRLSCPHFACREAAVNDLDAMGDRAFRLLFYGRFATDGEARAVCEDRFARRFECALCEGSGRCPHPITGRWETCSFCGYADQCRPCGGTGLSPRFPRGHRLFVRVER